MKKFIYLFACIFAFALYSCTETKVDDDSNGGTVDLTSSDLESLYGEITDVSFGDSTVTVYFASGTSLEFEYPEVVFPYIGSNGNWWINGVDTGLPSTGADGADGTDGTDGTDGATGATGADGADGADGANGVDGADGADGADGEDGVGISDITYENGYLTITLTDGTSTKFELSVTSDGSLVGSTVEDYLSDDSPMMISALKCGDIELMNFEYDSQNRLIAAQYNTTQFNEEVPMYVLEREYTSTTSDYDYKATVAEVATYDGQTKKLYSDYAYSYDTSFEFSNFVEELTATEVLNLIAPNGIKMLYHDESAGTNEYIYVKVGEDHDALTSDTKASLDNIICGQLYHNLFAEPYNVFYTYTDDTITMYMICRADNTPYWYASSDVVDGDYTTATFAVYERSFPNVQDAYQQQYYYYGNRVYGVYEFGSSSYLFNMDISRQTVYSANDSILYSDVYIWSDDEGSTSMDIVSLSMNESENTMYMYVPYFAYGFEDLYWQLRYMTEVTEGGSDNVTKTGSGDGYVEYEVKDAFWVSENYSNVLYLSEDGYEYDTNYVMPNSSSTYRVYEAGTMMDGGSIYFTENSDGELTGYEEDYEEDKIIFTMNDNGTINSIIVEWEEWEETLTDSADGDDDVTTDGSSDSSYESDSDVAIDTDSTTTTRIASVPTVTTERETVATFVYDSSDRLTSITLHDGEKSYDGLFTIVYDENGNPTQITADGAAIAAIGDDEIDEAMAVIGVASEQSTFDPATGKFTTKYVYNTSGATELLNISYNTSMKNFFGHSLDALTFMPFGLTVNNALEEITWAGHASYLFSEYSDFNSAGYPTTAKLSAAYNPFEFYDEDETYAAPVLTGISVGVSFEYTPMK